MPGGKSYEAYFDTNKELWNKKTAVHVRSEFYDVDGFKSGKSSLNHIELEEVGDVQGKTMLHLQCHFGLDTLSWARMGAKTTGVDFSEEAIQLARSLSEETGIPSDFICSNIYDLEQNLDQKFDIVFTSYGTIGWLPDLDKWASLISHALNDDGFFYIVEFHPVIWMYDDKLEKVKYAYHNKGPIVEETEGTYADRTANIKQVEYGWNHSLGEVINSLIQHGMSIRFLNEYPYSPYNVFQNMEKNPDGFWWHKKYKDKIPMLYSLKAHKV